MLSWRNMDRMLPLLTWEVIPLLSQKNPFRNCRAGPALKRKEHIKKRLSLGNIQKFTDIEYEW